MSFKNNRAVWTIIIIGVCLRLIWTFMRWEWLRVVVYDDAFYYFTIARTFLETGMFSADGITLTNGFHPLWLFTVMPIWLIADGQVAIRMVMGLATVIDTVAVLVLWRFLRDLPREYLAWVIGLYFLNPVVITQSMSGMETPLVILVALSWIWAVNERRTAWMGLLGGLLFLARTDMIFLVTAGYFYHWYQQYRESRLRYAKPRNTNFEDMAKGGDVFNHGVIKAMKPKLKFDVTPVIVSFLVTVPWLVVNLHLFGTIFQSSGSAYPWLVHHEFSQEHLYGGLRFWEEILTNLWNALRHISAYWGGVVIFVMLVTLRWNALRHIVRRNPMPFLWAFIGMGAALLIHAVIRWHIRIWYFQVFYLLTVLVLTPMIMSLKKKKIWLLVFMVIGWTYICGSMFKSIGAFARAYVIQERAIEATNMIDRLPDGIRVAAWNSGYPQYFAKRSISVINLDGLVNNGVLDYYRDKRLYAYLDSMQIGAIVDNSMYIDAFGRFLEDGAKGFFYKYQEINDIGVEGNDMTLLIISEDPPQARADSTMGLLLRVPQ